MTLPRMDVLRQCHCLDSLTACHHHSLVSSSLRLSSTFFSFFLSLGSLLYSLREKGEDCVLSFSLGVLVSPLVS